jgi:Protein of unknown function (DUF1573)
MIPTTVRKVAIWLLAGASVVLWARPGIALGELAEVTLPVSSHDFGTVRQGETVTYAFTVRNGGTTAVQIERIELPWPGLTARFKRVIAAGEDVRVALGWNTSVVTGSLAGEAVLTLNGAAEPRLTLPLKALVKPLMEFRPYGAVFLSVFQGETLERPVTLVNNDDRPVHVTGVETDGSHAVAALDTIETGKIYRVRVTIPSGVPPGRYREVVYVRTDHPTVSRLPIGVNALVKTDVYVNPAEVDFGTVSLRRLSTSPQALDFLTQTFIVRKRAGEFEIRSLTSDVPALQLSQEPAGPSAAFRIDVRLAKDRLEPGQLTGSIRVMTSDPAFPEFIVPVRGELR